MNKTDRDNIEMSLSRLSSGVILLQRVNDSKISQVQALRKSPTPAENKLWQYLRRNQISGYKFRRQQTIEGFIVDFFCHQAKLIIEVDGEVHDSEIQQEIDTHRRNVFNARGLMEIRFRNAEIMNMIEHVINKITEITTKRITGSSNTNILSHSPP